MDNDQFRKFNEFNKVVDEIIAGEQPSLEHATNEEEINMLRVAILLRSAATEVEQPTPNFISRLRDRMRDSRKQTMKRDARNRRTLVLSSAASLVMGLLGGLGVNRIFAPAQPQQATSTPPSQAQTISTPAATPQPTRPLVTSSKALWVRVANVADVRPGEAYSFRAGAIDGFLLWHDDKVIAISAICTHMGCHLRWNVDSQDLTCPCHEAKFDINGTLLNTYNRSTLPPLPRPEVEVRDGGEVYVKTVI